MAVLSPDEGFLLVGTNFDERPWPNPDGTPKLVGSNAPDPDGLIVFPVSGDGTLGTPSFHDAGGGSPFYMVFLHARPDTFITGTAVGDGLVMSSIDAEGRIGIGPLVRLDSSAGEPSEVCWLAISPDDRLVFTTNFGYSDISSYRIDGTELAIAKDPALPLKASSLLLHETHHARGHSRSYSRNRSRNYSRSRFSASVRDHGVS
jgi:hypothetical protein